MIRQKPKPPSTQRRFVHPWAELEYLCKKVRFWLYVGKRKPRAERYLARLEKVLSQLPENDMAILREEGLALFHEIKGDIRNAIAHREREIWLMEQLHQEALSPKYAETTKSFMLRDRQHEDLRERRAILEILKKEEGRKTSN